jgi:hypothetical protein
MIHKESIQMYSKPKRRVIIIASLNVLGRSVGFMPFRMDSKFCKVRHKG